jgi:hypothetical protein
VTAVRYGDLWRSLEREAGAQAAPSLVKRLIEAAPGTELHLAVSSLEGRHYLMIRMADGWDEDTSSLPKWRGAKIGPMRGEERPTPHRFLVIEQGDESPGEVFELLAADIADAVLSREAPREIGAVVSSRLERWKAFFEERGLVGLGPEAQQGLFGELWFLRDHLIPRMGAAAAVMSWDVSHRAVHDFQFPRHAIEVKTSSAKQHQRIHIASERQLDTVGLDSLHVVVVSLSVVRGGGETLPAIVASLRAALSQTPQIARAFQDKLLDEGYLQSHEEHYRAGYTVRSVRAYAVRPGFPRLLEADLKPGVGDVSYSVVLSACEPLRVELADALAVLGARP